MTIRSEPDIQADRITFTVEHPYITCFSIPASTANSMSKDNLQNYIADMYVDSFFAKAYGRDIVELTAMNASDDTSISEFVYILQENIDRRIAFIRTQLREELKNTQIEATRETTSRFRLT